MNRITEVIETLVAEARLRKMNVVAEEDYFEAKASEARSALIQECIGPVLRGIGVDTISLVNSKSGVSEYLIRVVSEGDLPEDLVDALNGVGARTNRSTLCLINSGTVEFYMSEKTSINLLSQYGELK